MSRRWTTELAVGIGAWDVSVRLRPRWPGGTRGEARSFPLTMAQDTRQLGERLARAVQLATTDGPGACVPHTARIVFGDAWAHYALVTGDFRLMGEADAARIGSEYLRAALDLRELPLAVATEVLPGGRALLAAGLERSVLDVATATLARVGIRVRSATTWFAAIAPGWRPALAGRDCFVASVFEDTLQLLMVQRGQWKAFASDTTRRSSETDLRRRVELFARRLGETPESREIACASPLPLESARTAAKPAGDAADTAAPETPPGWRTLLAPRIKPGEPTSLALLGALT